MTGVQRSFLLVGLGLGLMVAALMLYLQTALNQAVQVPGATGVSGTTQSVPKASATNPPAPVASQPAPGGNQAAPTAPVTPMAPAAGETTAPVTAPAAGQTATPVTSPAASQPAPEPLTFVVRDGQDFLTVARELQAAKLIGNTDAFLAKVRANDWSGRLQVRTYHFKPGTSEDAILQELITVK